MKTFTDLGLATPLLDALAEQGYQSPTPIQAQAIPPALEGRDILGTAQTGTGKTAAFTLPILQQLMPVATHPGKRPIRVLILTPTRELALQIDESIGLYGAHLKLNHAVIFGGVGQKPQTDALRRGVDLLTATPGRLLDLMDQGFVDLKQLTHFVLDEADRMLDMGFIHDVKKVIAKLPKKRQTLFFSATMPKEVVALSDQLLHNPVRVAVAPVSTTAETVQQKIYFVDQKTKRFLLRDLLQDSAEEIPSVLVFTRTKHGADRVVKDLVKAGISAQAIHGNKSQNARQNALSNFKSRETRVLVATDIAARGIDIDELTHVINFEIPNIPETYVHRIGRTGRAGLSGVAWSFVDKEERPYLKDIQRLIKMDIPVEENHAYPPGTAVEGASTSSDSGASESPAKGRSPRNTASSSEEGAPKKRRSRGGRNRRKPASSEASEGSRSESRGEGRSENRPAREARDSQEGAREPRAEGGNRRRGGRNRRPSGDVQRSEGARTEGTRSEGSRSEGSRSEGNRSEGNRSSSSRGRGGRNRSGAGAGSSSTSSGPKKGQKRSSGPNRPSLGDRTAAGKKAGSDKKKGGWLGRLFGG